MDVSWWKIGLLAVTFGLGITCVAYSAYATRKGWPVGEMLASSTSYIAILGVLSIFASPIAAAVIFPWWSAAIVIVGGFFIGLVVARALRQKVQILAIIGLPIVWVVDILYVIP